MDDDRVPQITPDALPVFLLALARAIRECQTAPASSIGIRDLIDSHLDDLLVTMGLDSFDRWSVLELQEMLDGMIRADIFSGVGAEHLKGWREILWPWMEDSLAEIPAEINRTHDDGYPRKESFHGGPATARHAGPTPPAFTDH